MPRWQDLDRTCPSIWLGGKGSVGYRLEITLDDCMSAGKCVGDYPKTFDFDDEELAVLIDGGEVLSDDDMIRVARNCPSRAIMVLDEDNNQVPT